MRRTVGAIARLAGAGGAIALLASSSAAAEPHAGVLALPRWFSAYRVEIGDVTGDGAQDVVIAGRRGPDRSDARVLVLAGDGCGGLAAPRGALTGGIDDLDLADLDGDGKAEIVTLGGRGLTVLDAGRDGQPAPVAATPMTLESGGRVGLGDVTGDGRADAVVNDWESGRWRIFAGVDGARFTETALALPLPHIGDVTLADLDGNGALDVVTDRDDALNAGAGNFRPGARIHVGDARAVGDLDRDGIPDVVSAWGGNGDASIQTDRGVGDGTMRPWRRWSDRRGYSSVALGDATGDGLLDVLANRGFLNNSNSRLGRDARGLALLVGDGAGGFSAQVEVDLPAMSGVIDESALDVASGDLDGDGRADLVGVSGLRAAPARLGWVRGFADGLVLEDAQISPGVLRPGRSAAVTVRLQRPALVSVELVARPGEHPLRLARRALPAGSSTLHVRLPRRAQRRHVRAGKRTMRIDAHTPGFTGSRRLAVTVAPRR